jgi:hypothetical protein
MIRISGDWATVGFSRTIPIPGSGLLTQSKLALCYCSRCCRDTWILPVIVEIQFDIRLTIKITRILCNSPKTLSVNPVSVAWSKLWLFIFKSFQLIIHNSVVGWGTMLQTVSWLAQFPMWKFDFLIDLILPATVCTWGQLILLTEMRIQESSRRYRATGRSVRLRSPEAFYDLTGNRAYNVAACSLVHQPTTLPRALTKNRTPHVFHKSTNDFLKNILKLH